MGPIFYVTEQTDAFPELRLASHPEVRIPGQTMQLSPDSNLVASVDGEGTLFLTSLHDYRSRPIARGVWRFFWRPGTGDLLYLKRDVQRDRMNYEWYLRTAQGKSTLLHSDSSLAAYYSSPSPSGRWLAYVRPQGLTSPVEELWAISLSDGTVHEIALGEWDSVSVQWVGPDTVALNATDDGKTLLLLQRLPDGQMRTYLEFNAYVRDLWAPDGRTIALRFDEKLQLLRDQKVVGECEGRWEPMAWSHDSRYLVVQTWNNFNARRFHVLDTQRLPTCDITAIPGLARYVLGWHSTHPAVLLAMGLSETGERVEVWEMQETGPVLVWRLEGANNAFWLGPPPGLVGFGTPAGP